MRKWLRRLIGWDEVSTVLTAMHQHLVNLEALLEAQGKEIAELKSLRQRREAKVKPLPSDWEQVQQIYGDDPLNYKENA